MFDGIQFHLEFGVTDQVTFLLTADHGFEGSDPTVTGSWQPALERLDIPLRDEGPGFIYLLPDDQGSAQPAGTARQRPGQPVTPG